MRISQCTFYLLVVWTDKRLDWLLESLEALRSLGVYRLLVMGLIVVALST